MYKPEDYKLCYVDSEYGKRAYFTTQNVKEQWGDDWNDAPYEHNAGSPYTYDEYDKAKGKPPWDILSIGYSALSTPADLAYNNSRYSVEMINSGMVAWLTDGKDIHIFAGVTLPDFIELVRHAEGEVYLTYKQWEWLK